MLNAVHRHMERLRWLILALVLVATAFFGWQARTLRFDNSLTIWFLDDDPDMVAYRQFLDRFETDDLIVLLMEPKAVFAPEFVAQLDRLTTAVEALDDVVEVTSLTNTDAVRANGDDVDVGPLVPKVPATAEEASALEARVLADPMLRGLLVTRSGAATAMAIEVRHDDGDFAYKTRLIARVKAAATRLLPGVSWTLTGGPVIDDAFFRYSERDTAVFVPAMAMALVLTLTWLFRSLWGMLLPVLLVIIANVWTFGLMALLGWPVNVISTILTPLVMAVGVADSVHIMSEVRRLRTEERRDPTEARRLAFTGLFTACLTTSLTTAAGMLSLVVAPLGPVRDFGFLSAAGVLFAFTLTFTFLPAALSLLPSRALASDRRGSEERVLGLLAGTGWRRAKLVAAGALVVLAISVVGASRLHVGNSMLAYFKSDDPIVTDMTRVDDLLGGTGTIEILIQAPAGAAEHRDFVDPELLERLDEARRYVEELPGIGRAFSVGDPLRQLNRAFTGRDSPPDSRPLAAQYMLLLEGSPLLERYLSSDRKLARMSAQVQISRWDQALLDLPQIEKRVQAIFGDLATTHITGYLKLMSNMEDYLISSQIRSFLLASVVVLAMIALLFRSLRMGLFSMVPNLPPILLVIGVMGWFHIALDAGTVMVASVLLGLVVDDTIHFLAHVRRQVRDGEALERAVENTERSAGRAIVITSVVLAASFATGMLGSFRPNVNFGMLSAIAVLAALVFDLVVLPAAISLVRPRL